MKYPKDCERLQSLLEEYGIEYDVEQCEELWGTLSSDWAASWLIMDKDPRVLWKMVEPYIKNRRVK